MTVSIVWFKRDLRVHDHEALVRALAAGPVLPLYVVEPEYWKQSYASGRQWQFLKSSLLALDRELTALGQPLWVVVGDAVTIFESLLVSQGICGIYSHQETGPQWTFDRDRRVKAWCMTRDVQWTELRQHGVVRGLRSRTGWAGQWGQLMAEPVLDVPKQIIGCGLPNRCAAEVLDSFCPQLDDECIDIAAGSTDALALLDSFLTDRGEGYRGGMSSPITGERVCSRLSSHFSLGTLSLRTAWQASEETRRQYQAEAGRGRFAQSLKSFGSRLHWHCHFMQKLESEPRLEMESLHRGFIGMRVADSTSTERLERLESGQLGWPFVDACLRCLAATGWLNFRMRAMLVAIASYHLWLDWRMTAPVFARWFTDFEAGIHFSQMQMQAGTTGINANRIYNPIKQSMDQDPDGQFIRRWIPALTEVPAPWIHQPWRMPLTMQQRFGVLIGRDYPEPIGDPVQMARDAKHRLSGWIAEHAMGTEARRVLNTHGSQMKQSRPRYGKKTPSTQLELGIE